MTWAVLHAAAGLACSSVAASLASPSAWGLRVFGLENGALEKANARNGSDMV